MIATWWAYALVTGLLIALACRLLEPVALAAGVSTRGVWVAGMVMMVAAVGVAGVAPSTPLSAHPAGAAGVPVGARIEADGPATAERIVSPLRQRVERVLLRFDARVAAATVRLSRWDRPLLLLWALLSAFLAGIVLHAALEGRRLRHLLERRDLAGTPVLLTEAVGPSAVGIGGPAILVPRWVLDLDPDLAALVLRHEREHLAARDPLLLLWTLFLVILAPWHLPLWWSRKRLALAIEVDCDRRVLGAHPDVRRYGQLLLLAAQRAPSTSWANLPVATVVAPLRPHASHLARRISAMTQPRRAHLPLRSIPLVAGTLALAALIVALPTPRGAQAQGAGEQGRAVVHLTSLGTTDVGDAMSILVYTTGGARVSVGRGQYTVTADTLRLDRLPAITADVTDGEVHIELRSPGRISVGGDVTGGAAREVSASGRHIVLLKGGIGIRSVP